MQTIGLGVCGTFGEPAGFQQVFYFDVFFQKSLDLNANAIEIYPNTSLYAVKRETTASSSSIAFCIYTYAKEHNSLRGGTFIGSCVVLHNSTADASTLYSLLQEFHTDNILNKKNIVEHTLQVNQAAKFEVVQPNSYEAVKSNVKNHRAQYTLINSNAKYFILPESHSSASHANQVINFFEYSVRQYQDVDTLYFSTNAEIISTIEKKKLLATKRWSDFIRNRNHQDKSSKNIPKAFEEWIYDGKSWNEKEVQERIYEYNRLFEYCSELNRTLQIHKETIIPTKKFSRYSITLSQYEKIKNILHVIQTRDLMVEIVMAIAFVVFISILYYVTHYNR